MDLRSVLVALEQHLTQLVLVQVPSEQPLVQPSSYCSSCKQTFRIRKLEQNRIRSLCHNQHRSSCSSS
ncbi:MAG: hypothetical protein AB8B50_11800 [Pirellulaceae bacterium]